GGHRLAEGRPERRPADQGHRLAGDHGSGHGASGGTAQRRGRPPAGFWLRLPHGAATHHHGAARPPRPSPGPRPPPAIPTTVLISKEGLTTESQRAQRKTRRRGKRGEQEGRRDKWNRKHPFFSLFSLFFCDLLCALCDSVVRLLPPWSDVMKIPLKWLA